ncbi:putative 115 kDa protein in type-1 retrotransposable element R1DM [Bactrocera oleae]|uniref:putative 115 kDa protein in type-1 retrotransposable element R1DM n=1 Tax=Bactrocera oleae TaxID=104688 RepID=UPI00387EADCB
MGVTGSSASAKGPVGKRVTAAKKLKSDRRLAAKILERHGDKQADQKSDQHASTLEWVKKVLSDVGDGKVGPNGPQTSIKRQRSQEGESSLGKKPRVGPAPLFSEIARLASSVELGVYDRSRGDGAISHDEWKRGAAAISAVFMKVVRGSPEPPPRCESAGWNLGIHKLIRCADERSALLYKEAVARVGEVWKGARLEAVAKSDLPMRPQVRVWLPAEPSTPAEIEEMLRYCNPSLPTQDWRVIRLERTEAPYRQALILLNKESLAPLSVTKGRSQDAPNRSRADGPLPPARVEESGKVPLSKMDVDPVLSDAVSTGADRQVMADPSSVSSICSKRLASTIWTMVRNSHCWRGVWRMKILQINLQHSKAASADLVLRLGRDEADVGLIQEPWLSSYGISGLRTNSHKLLAARSTGRTRACLLVRNELNVFLIPNFSNEDVVTVRLEDSAREIWLVSAYMPHDDEVEPTPNLLRMALAEARRKGAAVIIGSDASSRHTVWGSSDTNARGESFFDFICDVDLFICNRGNCPTFVTASRAEVLDVTLASREIAPLIWKWRILVDHSFSDHKYIGLSLDASRPKHRTYRNFRNTNWVLYCRKLRSALPTAPDRDSILSADAIEELVEVFSSVSRSALESSCPLKTEKSRGKPPWWTSELTEIRSSSRRLFNKARKSGSRDDWALYKAGLPIFKSDLKKAKRASWKAFCDSVEGCNESSRFRRILAKNPTPVGYLRNADSGWTTSSVESLRLLLDAHFPRNRFAEEVPLGEL